MYCSLLKHILSLFNHEMKILYDSSRYDLTHSSSSPCMSFNSTNTSAIVGLYVLKDRHQESRGDRYMGMYDRDVPVTMVLGPHLFHERLEALQCSVGTGQFVGSLNSYGYLVHVFYCGVVLPRIHLFGESATKPITTFTYRKQRQTTRGNRHRDKTRYR